MVWRNWSLLDVCCERVVLGSVCRAVLRTATLKEYIFRQPSKESQTSLDSGVRSYYIFS